MQESEQQLVIETKNLVKNFGKVKALNGLSLQVRRGEVHGFLGPNGAGKSTTIRILLGLLRKTSGEISLLDANPWKDAVKLHRRLAYVPGDVNLWPNLSGGEVIDLLGSLRGGLDQTRRQQLLKDFKLDPRKKCRTYSKGNRQKVALVAALASEVELYIMDEPTSGLDPLMEATFQDHVKQLKANGKTVLLSSHILAEAESLCDRVTIIREGRTVQTGELNQLRDLTRPTVKLASRQSLEALAQQPTVYNWQAKNGQVQFQIDHKAVDDLVKRLSSYKLEHLTIEPASLESLFLSQYSDNSAETKKG